MKWRNLMIVAMLFATNSAFAGTISGAGATFPYPLYSKWGYEYNKLTGEQINYQSIGSGGGIAQIKAKTVDFGASDAPLKNEDLEAAGLVQFPAIIGGVVPVVNISGVSAGQLKLTGDLLTDIYLGKITKWSDARITGLNPDVKLPDQAITVVHRADGSGTSWIFTNYLSNMSSEWKDKVGASNSVSWPTGVGGKGNEGVANYVKQIAGSIGYVEYAYALQNKMTHTQLKNKAGQFVDPSIESFQAAAANADWANAPGYYVVLTNQPGEKSWPITGASFILMQKVAMNDKNSKDVLKFFDWAYKHGADSATNLHYVPMPENVVSLVQSKWKEIKSTDQKSLWP